MARKNDPMERLNRECLLILQDQLESKDGKQSCLDCKVWDGSDEIILLCKVHRAKNDLEARSLARRLIVDKIDADGKLVLSATYELTGKQLLEYLAFAYKGGI